MAISDEDIQKVREATDLVALFGERVPVRQRGRDFWCCCPFHNEKTPSCKIDPSTQLWHCFGCGEGGDVFGFVMKMDDVNFPDAVRMLADRAHIDIVDDRGGNRVSSSKKARLREVCGETCAFYHEQLMRGKSAEADAARSYLGGRGFGGKVPKKWKLGFAPGRSMLVRHLSSKGFKYEEMVEANVAVQRDNGRVYDRFYDRVMFPIFDPQGECIAFGGRVIGDGEPKYLNSQETPLFHKSNVLYGLDKAKAAMTATGTAIIVEGYTDVIALHESGIENAVATLGTALTIQHVRIIARHASKRIVYLFDGDAAGQRAADRALGFIDESMTPEAGKTRVELCAVTLPDDLDPADFVAKRGVDELRELVAGAKPLIAYGIDRRLAAHDLSSAAGRTRAMADALSVLAPIKGSVLAKDYAVQLAGKLMMREQDVLDALAAVKAPRVYDRAEAGDAQQAAQPEPQVEISPAERSRRRFERRLVSLLAQNPSIALEHADSLAQTQWHDPTNGLLAQSILETLAANPSATPAQIVANASAKAPRAAGALTSAGVQENEDLASTIAFLIEELEIGDMEQTLISMNAQLKDPELSADERELVFAAIVELQKSVTAKRAAHKPTL